MDRQDDDPTEAQAGQVHETKRGRVRRLLLDPLDFRFAKGTDEAWAKRFLNGLADDLAYMPDERLAALRESLQSHGQGSARNQWPDRATVIAFAEWFAPRPLEELPALLSWFGSVEGPRAIAEGTLVETFEYISRRKAPPYTPQAQALIAESAAASARRLAILAERRARGLACGGDDLAWERWYLALREKCEAIVARERARKDGGQEGAAA